MTTLTPTDSQVWADFANSPLNNNIGFLLEIHVWKYGLAQARLPNLNTFNDPALDLTFDTSGVDCQIVSYLDSSLAYHILTKDQAIAYLQSAQFALDSLAYSLVRQTAATPPQTQALFGLLAERIYRIELALTNNVPLSNITSGYANLTVAKHDALTRIVALNQTGYYGNILNN